MIVTFLIIKVTILIPSVQTKLKDITANAMEEQLNSDVSIGEFRLGFPKKIKVNDILVAQNNSDTLLYLGEFSINIKLLPLFSHKIIARKIEFENLKADIGKLMEQFSADSSAVNETKDSESVSWEFAVNRLSVESSFVEYRDEDIGFNLILDIGTAHFLLGTVNLDTLIFFKHVEISETNVSYESLEIPEGDDSSAFEFADIRVEEAWLKKSKITYIDSASAILFFLEGDKVEASDLLVDITNEKIALDKAFSLNTSCAVEFLPENDTTPETYDYLNWGQYLWRVEGNELELKDFKLTVDYQGEPNPKGHFNNEHLDFYNVTAGLSDFIIDYDTLIVDINDLSGKENNGLEIVKLNGKMNHDGVNFVVHDMQLETPNSEYSANLVTSISPTNYLVLEGKTLNLNLNIKSKNWNEIDYFYPLYESFDFLSEDFGKGDFELQAKTSGSLNDLAILQFNFSYLDSTQIIATAKITDALISDSLQINLDIEKLMTSKHDIEFAASQTILDSSYALPSYLILSGKYIGSMDKHHFSGNINSDEANINILSTDIHLGDIPEYKVDLSANFKNISALTNMDIDEGRFNLKGNFKGDNLYRATSDIALGIDSLSYKNYYYKDFHIIGEIADGQFGTKINSLDSNLHFSISANGDLFEDKQDINIDVDILNVNLKALNLHKEEFTMEGKASFSVAVANENSYDINANIKNLDFNYVDTVYKMHPINMHFFTNYSQTLFDLESFYYNANFTANDYILDVVNSFKGLPGYYLADTEQNSVEFSVPEFQLTGQLEYPEAFARLFFPDFPSFEKLTIDGAYNDNRDEIDFNLSIPGINYNIVFADSLLLSISGTSEKLNYLCLTNFEVENLMTGKLNISGKFENSELITGLRYFDTFSNKYLDLTVQIDTTNENIIVHIIPDSLIFSYDRWEINPNNSFVFNSSTIAFNNFDLNSKGQQISIASFPEMNPQNLELELKDFNLGSLEQLFALDTLIAGTATANFKFLDLFNNPVIEGDLSIDNIFVHGFDAGQLTLSKIQAKDDEVSAVMALTGKYEDILVSGNYGYGKESNPIDFVLDIRTLDLSDLNYLLADKINDANGSLVGQIKITGNLNNPEVNGNLNFADAGIGLISLNNYFTLGTESISIKDNVINFDQFSIVNKKNQSAKILGQISFGSGKKTYSNLHIKTDDMEILNNTANDNDLIFGLLKASADIDIKGTPSELNMQANVKIDKSTSITYVFPESLSLNDNSGVVKFSKYVADTISVRDIKESHPVFSMESIKKINTGISIEKGAQFKLFFDSGGENYLDASIDGDMNYIIQDKNTDISGMFQVKKGKLHYSIPMVTVEDFTIEPGSFITMTNDMYNPHLNIIASAGIRASTESLIPDYKKVMTFKVLLYLIGDLNDIKLRFDISTQVSDAIVSAKLAQLTDSERNINALNLLVRGSFVISVHGSGAGSTSMAAAQIDKFYANQLNHMISDNIHFVDLHFDVQSYGDYSESGQEVFRRNYYYNVGKKFFHDRVRVNYKGRFGISTDLQAEESISTFVQNQLEVEYLITKNGTFRGVLFRKDQYEGLLEGEVIETGGGIRIKKNFYSIKDIFMNVEKEKEDKKEENK